MKTCRRYFYLSLVFERSFLQIVTLRQTFQNKVGPLQGISHVVKYRAILGPTGTRKTKSRISFKMEFSSSSPCDFAASQDYGFQPRD